MHLTQHMDRDVLVLVPGQKLTASEGKEDLSRAVHEALDAGVLKILLDCSSVEFIDSLGVGQIVASFVSTRNRGGRLILCGLRPRVVLVLRMASLHLVLDMREAGPEDVAW
ncbi:STAS domain-containing protein [Geothrix sp. 21YS21S-2]|uniref:STAS domain-containing protein n=1 Tax=Geothrix sp. 21YS21S-2 TaxID=3068893 RepID=UPI0027B982FB|nr:STAS domain-containing protein [Geothrix sp. 21YS21S-2]